MGLSLNKGDNTIHQYATNKDSSLTFRRLNDAPVDVKLDIMNSYRLDVSIADGQINERFVLFAVLVK